MLKLNLSFWPCPLALVLLDNSQNEVPKSNTPFTSIFWFFYKNVCHHRCYNHINLHILQWLLVKAFKFETQLFSPGGMQDWNYLNTNCFEVTIELGCVKYPLAKDLPKYWEQNRRSLLQFIHQVIKPVNITWTFSSLYSVLHLFTFMCQMCLCRSTMA